MTRGGGGGVKPRLLGSTLTVADSVALNGVLTSSQKEEYSQEAAAIALVGRGAWEGEGRFQG